MNNISTYNDKTKTRSEIHFDLVKDKFLKISCEYSVECIRERKDRVLNDLKYLMLEATCVKEATDYNNDYIDSNEPEMELNDAQRLELEYIWNTVLYKARAEVYVDNLIENISVATGDGIEETMAYCMKFFIIEKDPAFLNRTSAVYRWRVKDEEAENLLISIEFENIREFTLGNTEEYEYQEWLVLRAFSRVQRQVENLLIYTNSLQDE